ncbi:hypothetical protein BH23GEM3_BH23GEM3_06900 [soil metagenome]|jgi:5-methylcytosine-specific restriction endonuclease McrA|nr:hypothetical protein [Gemmatimonadota bacterium]
MSEPFTRCGRCAAPARSEVDFRLSVPMMKRRQYGGANAVTLRMPLCGSCGDKAYKHLTRFFGRMHFRPVDE